MREPDRLQQHWQALALAVHPALERRSSLAPLGCRLIRSGALVLVLVFFSDLTPLALLDQEIGQSLERRSRRLVTDRLQPLAVQHADTDFD